MTSLRNFYIKLNGLSSALLLSRKLPCLITAGNKYTYYSWSSMTAVHHPLLQPVGRCLKSRHSSLHTSSVHCKNYYEILGISRNASQKEVKKAYYQMAKKYHPDVNKNDPGAEKKFAEATEAYEVLGDEDKRQQYDSFGSSAFNNGGAGGSSPGGFRSSGFQYQASVDPEELFRKIFGDFRSQFGQNEPDFAESDFGYKASEEVTIQLTFKQAARGVEKDIKVNVVGTCPKCQGSRCMPGTKAVRCQYCNGTGVETISTGPFVMRQTCRYCAGTRMVLPHPCDECMGKGQTVQRKVVTVQVPAGISDGQTLRMSVGGKEMFILVKVKPNAYFRRQGDDVHTDATISMSQAVLGGATRIQGIYEDITVQIPAGSSSHTTITLPGKGLKRPSSYGQGDHILHLRIRTPSSLTEKQKALFQALAELETDTPGSIAGFARTGDGKETSDPLHAGAPNASEQTAEQQQSWLQKIKKAILG
ncbi:protein tumorous imaginal discs, mitochondrial isoform X2 [Hyalella azteca]|uniref:Protein tumorous imaginal discs, mitochondrial isoform X2 n=1 Tax=Hyalella azteca TaxID=294128 RepID=A0A8B7PBJ8_HYAAZ|nr:protein tumorous imaginal discs, mitochondrial isoform X2 [Hyalella azteca]